MDEPKAFHGGDPPLSQRWCQAESARHLVPGQSRNPVHPPRNSPPVGVARDGTETEQIEGVLGRVHAHPQGHHAHCSMARRDGWCMVDHDLSGLKNGVDGRGVRMVHGPDGLLNR